VTDEGPPWARILAYRPDAAGHVRACTALTWWPPAALDGLELVRVTAASAVEEILEALTVNERGVDPHAPPVPPERAEAFRADLDGCAALVARLLGEPAAGGMYLPVRAGVSELTGIATMVGYRRRGLGAAVTAALAQAAIDAGADLVFLTTDDDAAVRVSERAGFVAPDSLGGQLVNLDLST
jgi:GNAT superfamily N-acetyltransferase